MERETLEKAAGSGASKARQLDEDFSRYLLRSVLAGMYLSIVVLVYWSLVNNLHDSPFGKVIASSFFGVGLSIIVFTNSELFTSNNMYLAISSSVKRTTWNQTARLWGACWLGNLAGALILSLLLLGAGVLGDMPADHALHAGAVYKAQQSGLAIFLKGILANWVVCLAVWIAMRVKEDMTKIVVMVLVVFMFLYLGFEHSIANMGTFLMSMMAKGTLLMSDALFNLLWSTAGNIVGGAVFVGVAYAFLNTTRPIAGEAAETPSRLPMDVIDPKLAP